MTAGIRFSVCAQIHDAVLVNHYTEINIAGGRLTRTISNEIQINNRAGEKFTEVDIRYSKLLRVNKIIAHITDTNGKLIKKLNASDITSRSAISDISLYEDNMIKEFTLKHNVYPYILKYSYQEQTAQFLYIDYWCPVLDREIPTINASLSLSVPIGYKIKHKESFVNPPVIDTVQSELRFVWKVNYKVLPETEIYSPNISTFLPGVKIVPRDFLFAKKGSFDTWQSYGNWQYEINENLSALPESEITEIKTLINDIPDKNERIKALYHYLQDATRYINVSVKTGGMVPYPASYVAENKFGDCKALTNYFRAVLKIAGIDAFYVKVYAGDEIQPIDKALPAQQFNHIILCVPDNKDSVWLDCTSDGPYNYLGTFTQGREILLVEKNKSRILKTPELKMNDVKEHRNITIHFTSENSAIVNFETKLKGEKFDQLSQINREFRTEDQKLIIRNNFIPHDFDLIDYQLRPAHRDSVFIHFNYQTTTNKLLQKYGNETIIKTITLNLPKFKKPKERKYPVQVDYPVFMTDSQVYMIPDGFEVRILPLNKIIESEFGKFVIGIKKMDNEIKVFKSLQLNAQNCSLENYDKFYTFIKNSLDSDNSTVIVISKI